MNNVDKCYYCGKFIGKNDDFDTDTIYGFLSPDCQIVYHKECKDKQPFYCENNSAKINCFSQCNTCKSEEEI